MPEAVEKADVDDEFAMDAHARDSLYILPLSIVVLETPALKRCRLIKNGRLESVVEMFSNEATGSGQVSPYQLAQVMEWDEDEENKDLDTILRLSALPSYDVYSLRKELRRAGIEVNDFDDLKLSDDKASQLEDYMGRFTRPLIRAVFSDVDSASADYSNLMNMMKNPDVNEVMRRLQIMADKLGTEIQDIPHFLEDYGDTYLSLAYYQQCLDATAAPMTAFIDTLNDLRANYQLRNDPRLMETCTILQEKLNNVSSQITGMLESFVKSTENMWEDVSQDRFKNMKKVVNKYQAVIGGALCALTVKMNAWTQAFPDPKNAGPVKRADFVMLEMRQGIDKIQEVDDIGPLLATI